ncbi:hypothetical protein [Pelosinus baikalensis]|uniref:Uncharacterized protein n=1 Tax=Pelosinus baikalensis TaxID=2892015 RepID=A0ABS8HRD6_9FIRM|nr:hypothetical protein [Pelosinus baikalensis]MCC5465119.1 hypothetical protein [Pelosinus baikalensis]MCC5465266.1 hypothetical protein [Pelosinus baikalensis]
MILAILVILALLGVADLEETVGRIKSAGQDDSAGQGRAVGREEVAGLGKAAGRDKAAVHVNIAYTYIKKYTG